MRNKKIPVTLRIDEQILKDVDIAAKNEQRSRTSLIEWALKLYCLPNKKSNHE